jgi:hypothetical protein
MRLAFSCDPARSARTHYDPTYFQLGPIERRLYEVARSACGHGPIEVELEELRLQTGYQSSLKHFRYEVKRVADENSIPGFLFDLVDRAEAAGATRAKECGRDQREDYAEVTASERLISPLLPPANHVVALASERSPKARNMVIESTNVGRRKHEWPCKRSSKARILVAIGHRKHES